MSNMVNGAKQMHKDTIRYQEAATKSMIRTGIDPIMAAKAAADLTLEGVEEKFKNMFEKGDVPEFTSKMAQLGKGVLPFFSK